MGMGRTAERIETLKRAAVGARHNGKLANVLHPIQKDRFSKPFPWAIIVGTSALGAVVLYGATGWLWLVVHQGCIDNAPILAGEHNDTAPHRAELVVWFKPLLLRG